MNDVTNEERLAHLAEVQKVGVSPGSALNHLSDDVRLFHILFGHPAPLKPGKQSPDLVTRRAKWIRSEVIELETAETITEQADAYLDIIYFAIGGIVELGLKFPQRLWRLVQGANLAKIWPDGSVQKDEAGKVVKPEGWEAPDEAIANAIQEELHGNAKTDAEQANVLNVLGDEVVQRLTLATGGHVNMLMFAINEQGFVASTSNMDMENQRDFLRFINQSLAAGTVLVEHEKLTKQ